jgi:phosphoglycolate phosphatase
MKLVIFDCDGTLVDSQDAICGAMDHAFCGLGLPPPTRAAVLGIVGLSLPEAFRALAPRHGDAVLQALVDGYKGAFPRSGAGAIRHDALFPGARETVEMLARRTDIVLGIATGKSRRGVQRLLDQEGWNGHFLTVQTADDHPSNDAAALTVAGAHAVVDAFAILPALIDEALGTGEVLPP